MINKKNILIAVLAIMIGILMAIIFSRSSDYTEEYRDDIVEDVREILALPKDSVFINIIEAPRKGYGKEDFHGWVIGEPELGQYTIYLTSKTHKYNLPSVIAHEMVHIKQMHTGVLDFEYDKDGLRKDTEVIFRGKTYNLNFVPYQFRPWENEAFKIGKLVERQLEGNY